MIVSLATLSTVQPGIYSFYEGVFLDGQPTGRYFSFVLRIDEITLTSQFNGQIVLADGRVVELEAGTYSVRVWMEDADGCVRGIIRNEASKERIRFQSGDRLASFIRKSLKRVGGRSTEGLPGLDEGDNHGA